MKQKIKIFIILYLISSASSIFAKSPLSVQDNSNNLEFIHYQIQKGDSLWSIANHFDVNNKEIFIYKIKKLNNLDNSVLTVNEILLIPSNI